MIKILNFDTGPRHELLREWTGKVKGLQWRHETDPLKAIKGLEVGGVDILIFGGEIKTTEDFPSLTVVGKVLRMGARKVPFIFVSTWDSEEAKILKKILPPNKTLVCPFSQSFANILTEKARQIRKRNVEKERVG